MANTLASPTMGFQSLQRSEGGSPTAGQTSVWIASTDPGLMFRGDPVVTSTSPGANNSGNYVTSMNTLSSWSGGGFCVRGIFQGCYQYQPSASRIVWSNYYNGTVTGSTGDIKAYIIEDPAELFVVQASTRGTITSSYIGYNIGITANTTTGNTLSGYSNVTVESTAAASGSSWPFRIVAFYSDYAVPSGLAGPAGAGTTPWINGTDNTNVANMIVVRMNNCDRLNLTSKSTT